MKKFLTYLLILASVAMLIFSTYYLVQDKESFHLEQSVIYVDEGDEFELDAYWVNKKRGSSYKISSTDPTVVTYDEETNKFKALSGGIASVYYTTTNKKYQNVYCMVFVGEGSARFPYYISSAEQFLKIGNTEIENNKYTLDKAYKLIKDIDLKDIDLQNGIDEYGYIRPIGFGSGFSGTFNGDGHTIRNVKIKVNNSQANAGLFDTIDVGGSIVNLKIDNILIEGEVLNYVGSIAGQNFGIIERVEVNNATFSVINAKGAIGGIVGLNASSDEGSVEEKTYTRNYARVDRVSANIKMGIKYGEGTEEIFTGTGGYVGGLVGHNLGGIIVYSYATGDVFINKLTLLYGGLVGYNSYIDFNTTANNTYFSKSGGHIKDSYSSINLYVQEAVEYTQENGFTFGTNLQAVGGIIGRNENASVVEDAQESNINRIIGNYYNREALHIAELYNNMPIDIKGFFGVGINYYEGVKKDFNDEEYVVLGKSLAEMQDQSNYVSHVRKELIFASDGSGNVQTTKEVVVNWKFGTLWFIKNGINNNLPYLTYDNIEILDEIYDVADGKFIRTRQELETLTLDGNYIIVAHIDLGEDAYNLINDNPEKPWEPWRPIGTKTSPFVGSLQAAKYYNEETGKEEFFTIYNLTLDGSAHDSNEYGGLFGVTSGANGGEIKNLVLENVKASGYDYVGAVVGSNGYTSINKKGNEVKTTGLTITNVTVRNSEIVGNIAVGGIAGVNHGIITSSIVDDAYNKEGLSVGSTLIKLIPNDIKHSVGGIAGINNDIIVRSQVKGKTTVIADLPNNQDAQVTDVYEAYVGGIAGENLKDGIILNSGVIFANGDVKAGLNIKGGIGGITGYNIGQIQNVLIYKASVSGNYYNPNVYVGGVAGIVMETGTINNALVKESGVGGFNVGGLIGYLYYTNVKSEKGINYTFNDNNRLIDDINNFISISNSGTEDLAINGAMAGGIAGVVENGIISDVYALNSNISAVTYYEGEIFGNIPEGSKNPIQGVVAGVVGKLDFQSTSDGKIKAGVIQNVYVKVSFPAGGNKYAVSQSEFLLEPFIKNIPFTQTKINRPAGFITNYIFDDDSDGNAKHPQVSNAILEFFKKVQSLYKDIAFSAVKSGELQKSDIYKKFNFDTTIWDISNGYAKIKSLKGIENKINSFEVKINATNHYTIETSNSIILQASDWIIYVERGGDIEFKIVPASSYTIKDVVVKVNDEVITPQNSKYVIKNINSDLEIIIEYNYIYNPSTPNFPPNQNVPL